MEQYERLSRALAQWLTEAGRIEELVGDIERTMLTAPISDQEYEDLHDILYAAKQAEDGWSRADQALAEATLVQVRRRASAV